MRKTVAIAGGTALVAGIAALRVLGRRPTTSSASHVIQRASELEVGDIVHVSAGPEVFQAEIVCVDDGLIETAEKRFYSSEYVDQMLSSGEATVTVIVPAGARGMGESLARGLAQSARGEVVDLGDFREYADDEVTP